MTIYPMFLQRTINRRFHVFSSFRYCLLFGFQGSEAPGSFGFRSAGGDSEIRTRDPLLARQVLSQLSYTPGESFTRQSFVTVTGKESRTVCQTLLPVD